MRLRLCVIITYVNIYEHKNTRVFNGIASSLSSMVRLLLKIIAPNSFKLPFTRLPFTNDMKNFFTCKRNTTFDRPIAISQLNLSTPSNGTTLKSLSLPNHLQFMSLARNRADQTCFVMKLVANDASR